MLYEDLVRCSSEARRVRTLDNGQSLRTRVSKHDDPADCQVIDSFRHTVDEARAGAKS
jgi:hypothetical protein